MITCWKQNKKISKNNRKSEFLRHELGRKSSWWTEWCKPDFFFFFGYHITEVHVNMSNLIIAMTWLVPVIGLLCSWKRARCNGLPSAPCCSLKCEHLHRVFRHSGKNTKHLHIGGRGRRRKELSHQPNQRAFELISADGETERKGEWEDNEETNSDCSGEDEVHRYVQEGPHWMVLVTPRPPAQLLTQRRW